MKAKVLFINSPWYRLQGLVSTYPPMGSLYIAGLLEQHDYPCAVWNADYSEKAEGVTEGSSTIRMREVSSQYDRYLGILRDTAHPLWREVEQVLAQQRPDVLGLVTYTASVGSVRNVAAIAKRLNPHTMVLCGGPHATVLPEDLIGDPNIDFVLIGEGEHATLALLEANGDPAKLKAVAGLWHKLDGVPAFTGARGGYEDLNTLPLPAKHLLLGREKLPSVVFQPIFTARGCPFQCIYCSSHRIHGRRVRTVATETTIREIKQLRRDFDVHHLFICDDTFGQDQAHTRALLERIIAEKMGITFGCQTRGERLTEELVALMKRAGCTQASIGVETGSPRIRELIRKGNTVDDVRHGVRMLRRYNIEVAAFFMFGFPGETRADIEQSLALLEEIRPYTAHCNIATPDPGTELLTMVQKQGRMSGKVEWSTFYHQNPDLFFIEDLTREETRQLLRELQQRFDRLNKRQQRLDLLKRLPLYVKIIMKEKLYRHPRYLWNKLKDLL